MGEAASAKQADVQDAIDSASNGDTVTIPAGTETWTDSAISLDKEIAIIGAGKGSTIITVNNGGAAFGVDNNIHNWRFSALRFNKGASADMAFDIGGESSQNYHDFRIDTCLFSGFSACIQMYGAGSAAYGVIDNCDFEEWTSSAVRLYGTNATAWGEESQLGTKNFIFVEDCSFDTKGVRAAHAIAGGWGARYVFRYNTLTESDGARMDGHIDFHGNCFYGRGVREVEIYENTLITDVTTYPWRRGIYARGGTGVIYDNTFSGDWSGSETFVFGGYRVCSPGDCGLGEADDYPVIDQIGRGKDQALDPMYIWDNSGLVVSHACISLESYIVEETDYYLTEKSGYTPYTYPHPLRDSAPAAGPSRLVMVLS